MNSTSLDINGRLLSRNEILQNAATVRDSAEAAEWEKQFWSFAGEWASGKETFQVETSGSTGTPDKVVFSRDEMIKSALLTGKFFGLRQGDTALLALPVQFIAGKMMVVRAFVLGLKLYTAEPAANPFLDFSMPVDFVALTPMQLSNILQQGNSPEILDRCGTAIIGGGPVNEATETKLKSFHCRFFHTYGMTETLTHIAVRKMNHPEPESSFTPLEGVTISLDDRGCLVVRAEHLGNRTVVTNDLAEIIEDNSFRINGRYDFIINSGGIKISPEATERKVESLIPVPFVITGLPDPVLGERVVLVTEGKQWKPDHPKEFFRQAGLTSYEQPRTFLYLQEFPRTASGKVKRDEIKRLVSDRYKTQ
ncbi:MAG: AMP-binding protein [Bacteroidales bacterium]